LQDEGFISDAAEAGSALQRGSERVGRCHDVIQQSEIAAVKIFGEVKTQEIIMKRSCGGFKKGDLAPNVDAMIRIIDLLAGQTNA